MTQQTLDLVAEVVEPTVADADLAVCEGYGDSVQNCTHWGGGWNCR